MATKNISITEEAYMRLDQLRREKESFSEIINRITDARDIMQFAGILSKASADALEDSIAQQRIRYNEAVRRRNRKLRTNTS